MKAERCVVDTNVLISALLQPSGRTAEVLERHPGCGRRAPPLRRDVRRVASRLMRSKFDRYVDQALRQRFLSDLASVAEWVTITGVVHACRDPDDDKFLETAINGEADCIVTGDADLLTLDPFNGVRILTPRDFLEAVRNAGRD